MLRSRLLLAACTLLAASAGTRSGRADDNEATARAIFDQATRDMDAGAYDKACPALVQVVKLSRGIGSMIKLGKCYEAHGKLASAWASFKEAADAAHLASDGREAAADAKARELLPKLSRLAVTVRADAARVAGLTLKRDDVELVQAQWNTDLPVDSGKHVVTAFAPGKKSWTGTVDVATAAGTTTLDVPELEDQPAPAPVPVPVPARAPAVSSRSTWSPLRTTGLVVGGAGVAGLVVGSVSGAMALSTKSANCTSSGSTWLCQNGAASTAYGQATASTVGFVAGGVLLAAGVTLFLVAPKGGQEEAAARPAVTPIAGPSFGGLQLAGGW